MSPRIRPGRTVGGKRDDGPKRAEEERTLPRVIRVGVAGHRTFEDSEGVTTRVRAALARLLRLASGAGDEGDGARVRLEVISPIAEGADRLVAREALALPGTTLVAALPFPRDDYALDFASEESQREYADFLAKARAVEVMPPAPTREAGHERVGHWVVDHCDALVALWDGEPSRGQGGTAEIIAYAAERGVPLLWVRVSRP